MASLSPLVLLVLANLSQASESETMVITANRTETAISDVAATMWVVDQYELEKALNTGADLKNVLGQFIPAFDFGSNARTNFSQNLRGRTALVMIDGVSLNSTRNISRQLDSIDPLNIARVEVLSGATSVYGAGAAGGIINIITKKAASEDLMVETKIGAATGFNNSDDHSKQIAVALSGGSEKLRGRVSFAYSETGGLYDANGNIVRPDITQTDLQFNDTVDVMANFEFIADEQQSLSVIAQYYNSEQDTNYSTYLGENLMGLFNPALIETREGLQLNEQPNTERMMFNTQYHHDDIWSSQLLVQAYYRSESIRFFPFPTIVKVQGSPLPGSAYPIYGASEQNTSVLGAKLALIKEFETVTATFGVDASEESFDADQTLFDQVTSVNSGGMVFTPAQNVQRYPDVDSRYAALFSQLEMEVTPELLLSGGFRYERIKHEMGDNVGVLQQHLSQLGFYGNGKPETIKGGKTDYDEWLFNFGGVYHLNNAMQVWSNVSQGFDVPDPAKFFGQGQYDGPNGEGASLVSSTSVATSELEGVKTNSFELGWRMDDGDINAQVAAYISLSDKTVSFDKTSYAVLVEDDDKRIYGVEGQAVYQLSDAIYTGINAHYVKSETKVNASWQDLSAAYASPSSASVWLGYDEVDFGAELRVNSFLSYEDDGGAKLQSYTLANLSTYYALAVGRLNFGVTNLFNRDYETLWSQRSQMLYGLSAPKEIFTHNGQGRTFAISYSATF